MVRDGWSRGRTYTRGLCLGGPGYGGGEVAILFVYGGRRRGGGGSGLIEVKSRI